MRIFILLVLLVVVIAVPVAYVVMHSATPIVELAAPVTALGQSTPVSVHVRDPHGVRAIKATIEQNGSSFPLFEESQPSTDADQTVNFTAGVKTTPQLRDGKVKLIIEATSNDLLRKTGRVERDLTVVTQPPSVTADSDQHYLYLGMADLATMTVSGSWTEAGVRVGDQKFRAWPLPGGKPGMFSLYAFAWNMPPGTAPLVYASNGEVEATSPLVVQFPKKEQPHYTTHDLQISDAFMNKVINELDPNGAGDPVQRFVKINSEMRRANNQTLADLRLKTADHFLWSRPFIRQAHSQAEANFADVRNYIYQGKKIDQQVHLG
ncbi:MAG: M23 family metallopeptidase, partial [Terriglobales bacterium]